MLYNFFPLTLFDAIIILSEANFVAPYKFIGEAALSVLNAINCFTLFSKHPSIIFCAPIILVLTASNGLYSVAGTCFNAAAWIAISTSFKAKDNLSLSLTSPIKNLSLFFIKKF